MDLNAFPDTVLRAVFDRVPLSDLIQHIPLVCHRWHSLQTSVLSQKIKKPLAITLFVGPNSKRELNLSSVTIPFAGELTNEDGSQLFPSPMDDSRLSLKLTLSTLTSERVDSLIYKLKNVTFVEMCFRHAPTITIAIPLIIRLLDHWARTLKTLKLRCRFTENSWMLRDEDRGAGVFVDEPSVVLVPLIETVNKLPMLEHLTLDLHEDLGTRRPLDLPIIGRLKEFYFNSYCDKLDNLFSSLKRYGEPNDQLRAIGLGCYEKFDKFLKKFADSPLKPRFTLLRHIGEYQLGVEMDFCGRERFLNTFTNLTSFTTGMRDLNLVKLTATLAPLHNLVYLYLCTTGPMSQYDDDPVDQIRPLPSVKVLTLLAGSSSHKGLTSKHWGRMFPNLQVIMFFHNTHRCSLCGHNPDDFTFELEKVAACVRRTLLPLKQQFRRTLKKLYYCLNDDEDNIKVFTPDTI